MDPTTEIATGVEKVEKEIDIRQSPKLEDIRRQTKDAAGKLVREMDALAGSNPDTDLSDEKKGMQELSDELEGLNHSDKAEPSPKASQDIEDDHHPEIVEGKKATRRLELLGVKEALSKSDKRREFFKELTDKQYTKMFGYINSITRGQPIEYDYKDGQLPMEATPGLDDKERLMNMAFDTARNILRNEELEDSQALRIAGLTLAGAINYIHPYENGNGRAGRVAHYLVEYGNQRGENAFQDELYAIIGKLPMYDTDRAKALDDTPPPELGIELGRHVSKEMKFENDRDLASSKVEAFLKMMQGNLAIPINEEVPLRNNASYAKGITPPVERIQAGSINGLELYAKNYLYQSTIPNRNPNSIPEGANKVLAERKKAKETFSLPMDFV